MLIPNSRIMRRITLLLGFLILTSLQHAGAQINTFAGASFTPSFTGVRSDDASFRPGYSAGFSYIYWDFTNWFIKSGINYSFRSSEILDYPEYFTNVYNNPPVPVRMVYDQRSLAVPLTAYFAFYNRNENALLVTAGMELLLTTSVTYTHDTYGSSTLRSADLDNRFKTQLGLGVGYQRELTNFLYLNLVPSFYMDIRSDRPFNTIRLTMELIYGIY